MQKEWIFLIIGLAAGALVAWLLANARSKGEQKGLESVNQLLSKSELELKDSLVDERSKNEGLKAELAAMQQKLNNLLEKLEDKTEESKQVQKRFTEQFENLANKILDEKSQKFTEQNQESLKHILNPLKEKIGDFEKKVETSHKESIDRHAALREQIMGLQQSSTQISQEALNLTKALKGDSKVQGNWGEFVLERILEKSGLEKGREYDVQQSFKLDNGSRVVPDVVINLPGGKKMIIDSKVSLTAYEQLMNADTKEDEALFEKAHLASIKKHIDELGAKNYHDLYQMESPDFVLLFIPIEPAFAVALNSDNSLYTKAFEKNIVIVTSATLLATLRTIDTMWNNEKQQQNAIQIAEHAGRMYDQFVNILDDFKKIGNQLDTVQNSYNTSMKKFTGKGNVFTKMEKLKKLGAKANKAISDDWKKRTEE